MINMPKPTRTPERIKPEAFEALKSYQQADADGVMVLVSRQALDEAIAALQSPAPVIFDISNLSDQELEKLWKDVKEPGTISVMQSPAGEWRLVGGAPRNTRVQLWGKDVGQITWTFCTDENFECPDGFTHWLPLPPAPTGEVE